MEKSQSDRRLGDERRKYPRYPYSRYIFFATQRRFFEGELLNYSDYDIIMTYEQQIRGLINYYTLAHDVVKKMGKIRYLYEQSLVKT